MDNTIIVALLGCIGSFASGIVGIVAAQKMTSYRIEQLEQKVDRLTDMNTRVTVLETKVSENTRDIEKLEGRIGDSKN